jgi:acyl transferase domain-containing protein
MFTTRFVFGFNRDYVGRPDEPGKYNTSMCGFINSIDHFDTREFGISMKEAQQLDPSSRLILEVAHLVCTCNSDGLPSSPLTFL